MKIFIAGGRHFKQSPVVRDTLEKLKPTQILHGAQSGAQAEAIEWAKLNNVPQAAYDVDFTRHGSIAGPIRNARVLDENPDLDLIVAFPGGLVTDDLVRRALGQRIKVLRVVPDDQSTVP